MFGSGQGATANPTVKVYHYTDQWCSQQIESSGILRKATNHTHYGDGVYFTKQSVKDGFTKRQLAHTCFRAGAKAALRGGRLNWVVEVDVPSNEIIKCPDSRDIWRYPDKHMKLNDYKYSIHSVKGDSACSSDSDDGRRGHGFRYDFDSDSDNDFGYGFF